MSDSFTFNRRPSPSPSPSQLQPQPVSRRSTTPNTLSIFDLDATSLDLDPPVPVSSALKRKTSSGPQTLGPNVPQTHSASSLISTPRNAAATSAPPLIQVSTLKKADQDFMNLPLLSDQERALLKNMKPVSTEVVLCGRPYQICVRYIEAPVEEGNLCVFLHGFDSKASGLMWAKLFLPLHECGFSILCFDWPGFGRSSGIAAQTSTWKQESEQLFFTMLSRFGAQKNSGRVTVFAQSGGAGIFLRALQQEPGRFAKRHVLDVPIMGTWPKLADFGLMLKSHNIRLRTTWTPDEGEFMRACASYKALKALSRTEYGPWGSFYDLRKDITEHYLSLFIPPPEVHKLTRHSRGLADIYLPSEKYVSDVIQFLGVRSVSACLQNNHVLRGVVCETCGAPLHSQDEVEVHRCWCTQS